MKNLKRLRVTGLALLFLFMASSLSAATYTTLASGDWNNTSNVWSLDGVTACGCEPGATSNGSHLVIRHDITTTGNLFLTAGSTLIIEPSGTLEGAFNMNVSDGSFWAYGHSTFAKFVISTTGVANIEGSLLTLSNRLILEGIMNINGGYLYMASGNVSIAETGELNSSNGGKLDAFGGNIDNEGVVDICPSCCMTTRGNWKNSGTVLGSGSATTTQGNMSNLGFWSTDVVWCSVGFDSGMPTPENCADANSTCGMTVLPVELIDFNVELDDNDQIKLSWTTLSENNSDYFVVLKSLDANNWTEIGRVESAGNSNAEVNYSTIDYNSDFKIAYYRIKQLDVDGSFDLYEIKAVAGVHSADFEMFPNPSRENQTLTMVNVENSMISILSSNGQAMKSIQSQANTEILDISELNSGVYFVNVNSLTGESTTKKLVILD